MFSHLPTNERRLAEQDHHEARREAADLRNERFAEMQSIRLPAEPCPPGHRTTCCRQCGEISHVSAQAVNPLCLRCAAMIDAHNRIAVEQEMRHTMPAED